MPMRLDTNLTFKFYNRSMRSNFLTNRAKRDLLSEKSGISYLRVQDENNNIIYAGSTSS